MGEDKFNFSVTGCNIPQLKYLIFKTFCHDRLKN